MKQLELTLQKRLLIVEYEAEQINEIFEYCKVHPQKFSNINGICKFICKGSEFTEEIAKEFVDQRNIEEYEIFYDYRNERWFDYSMTALDSFISAIEAKQNELGITIDLSKSLIFEIL